MRYHSKKNITAATTAIQETLLNVKHLPAWMEHGDAIIARKHAACSTRKKFLYDTHQKYLEEHIGEEQDGPPVLKEITANELAQLAASFEVVHCSPSH